MATDLINLEDDDIINVDVDIITDKNHIDKISGNIYKFHNTWNLWYHHHKNNWKIDGYRNIFNITTICDFWNLFNNFELIGGIHNMHYFIMKNNIQPIWEHPLNKNGGCWSFKIPSEIAFNLFTKLSIYMVGETLTPNSDIINGISICLKNPTTSVIKIWNNTTKANSINLLPKDIVNEYGYNIIYKAHIPEY